MTQHSPYDSQSPSNSGQQNKTLIMVIVIVIALILCCCCGATLWFLWEYGDQILYELDLNISLMLTRFI